jgi:hypothetical protein
MWHTLALHLQKFKYKAHGDCTRFDGTAQPVTFDFLSELRNSFLNTDQMKKFVQYFYDNVVNSVIAGSEGDLFRKVMGQPSGQGNTLHDNSIIHTMYFFYHWCLFVVPKDPVKFRSSWASFQEHVCLVIMGDDVVYSYGEDVVEYMHPSKVAESFKSLGVTLKFGEEVTENVEDLEFCSMRWQIDGGVYVPIMKRDKMLASLLLKDNENHRLYLTRLLGIRVESWWDPYMREFTNSLLKWFLIKYEGELHSKKSHCPSIFHDDPDFDTVMILNWPALVIDYHYKQAFA